MELIDFSKLNVMGNVGQDPEIKFFEDGNCLAKFSLAVRRGKDETDWFSIQVRNKKAQTIADYVKKGTKLSISAHLNVKESLKTWEDKVTGETRSKLVFDLDDFSFAGSKQEAEG